MTQPAEEIADQLVRVLMDPLTSSEKASSQSSRLAQD